jgi:hypothetical protein
MIAALLAAAVLAQAPAAAAPAPQAAAPAAKPKAKSDLVCQDDTPTGSRLSKRTCVTKSSQEERERVTDYAVDRMMKTPTVLVPH